MGFLNNVEKKLIKRGTHTLSHFAHVGVHAFSDYKQRRVASYAASVSFYAIFSVFPIMAFLVYLVGKLIGVEQTEHTAPLVLKIIKDYVPAIQGWIEKGVFDVMTGNAATSWVNAVLLGWSGLGLFSALLSAIEQLPEDVHDSGRANITQIFLAAWTLVIFAVVATTVVFCELAGRSSQMPFWVLWLPFEVQDIVYFLAQTGVLLGLVSVLSVAALFKLLLPCAVSLRSTMIAAGLFTILVMLSRSAYWVYMHHYNEHAIESSYGAFSALILIMLWIHFMVSCLLFSGLFALHLDRNPMPLAEARASRAA